LVTDPGPTTYPRFAVSVRLSVFLAIAAAGGLSVLAAAIGVSGAETGESGEFAVRMKQGEVANAEGTPTVAREIWSRAAELPGIGPQERSRALIRVAATHAAESDDFTAAKVAEEVLLIGEASARTRLEAWALVAKAYAQYGNAAAWTKVRDACRSILAQPEATEPERLLAQQGSVPAYLALRAYPEAAQVQQALAENPALGLLDRETHRLGFARALLTQRNFADCRAVLETARLHLSRGPNTPAEAPRIHELLAEYQLLLALSFYEEGDEPRARLELERVPAMPGQTATSRQTREARLRLHLRQWLPQTEPVLKVLFVGSSHTIRGNIPLLVEQLAASAPAGSLRIVAGEQTRMGTGMRNHWNDGDAPDTARGRIAAEPWDVVVVETFYRMTRNDMAQYGRWYADTVGKRGARLLIYETPVAKASAYPEGYQDFHDSNVWLGKQLQAPVAPSVRAWMSVLGNQPSEASLKALYSDWIHASAKGAYLTACTLYATLTDQSPVGLFVPEGLLSPEEALRYQTAAWQAARETRLELEKSGPTKTP
jgi:hypothetical protein